MLLLTAATVRIVQRDGIRFNSTRYVSPVLAAYVGETVTIRHDPRDAAEVRVYHCNHYLCRAIAPELATASITLEQLQDARTTRRRELKQQLRNRRSVADAIPDDHRYSILTPSAPTVADEPPTDSTPAPRHRLRIYASD